MTSTIAENIRSPDERLPTSHPPLPPDPSISAHFAHGVPRALRAASTAPAALSRAPVSSGSSAHSNPLLQLPRPLPRPPAHALCRPLRRRAPPPFRRLRRRPSHPPPVLPRLPRAT